MFVVLSFLWDFINYRKWNIVILIILLVFVTLSVPFCFSVILMLLPIYLFILFYYNQVIGDNEFILLNKKYFIWNILRNIFWDEPRFFIYRVLYESNQIKLSYQRDEITLIRYVVSVFLLNSKWVLIWPGRYILTSITRFSRIIWEQQSCGYELSIPLIVTGYCNQVMQAHNYNLTLGNYISLQ